MRSLRAGLNAWMEMADLNATFERQLRLGVGAFVMRNMRVAMSTWKAFASERAASLHARPGVIPGLLALRKTYILCALCAAARSPRRRDRCGASRAQGDALAAAEEGARLGSNRLDLPG